MKRAAVNKKVKVLEITQASFDCAHRARQPVQLTTTSNEI